MNNTEVQLSADQNDVIHQAALRQQKQVALAGDKSQAIPVKMGGGGGEAACASAEQTGADTSAGAAGVGLANTLSILIL